MDYSSLRANPGHLTKDLERPDKKTAIEAYVSRFSGAVQPVCRPEGCEGLVVPDRVSEKKKRKEKEKKRRKEEKDKKDKKKKHKKKSKEDKEDKRDKEGEDEDTVEHKGSRQTLKRRSNERNCSNKKKKY